MVVRTLGSGRDVAGLYIGPRNARRHFHRGLQHIELHLGHLRIHCDLPPQFWRGQPEINDARLADWLSSRIFHGKPFRAPVPVAMIPKGKNSFRVLPFCMPAVSSNGLAKIGPPPAAMRARRPAAAPHAPLRRPAGMNGE